MSKIFYIGSQWNSNNYGSFKIVGKSPKWNYYMCEFEDGTIVEVKSTHIKSGAVRNPKKINVFGVGFVGEGIWKATLNNKNTKEYDLWHSMINRCYSNNVYHTYKNCTVDERWHNFQNFCEDIQELEGYNEWKNNNKKRAWSLDKDTKQPNTKDKIYSKDTCMFVSLGDNITEMNKRTKPTGLTYIAINILNNYSEEFTMHADFARKWNLHNASIGRCIKGTQKTTKGWIIKIKYENMEE